MNKINVKANNRENPWEKWYVYIIRLYIPNVIFQHKPNFSIYSPCKLRFEFLP